MDFNFNSLEKKNPNRIYCWIDGGCHNSGRWKGYGAWGVRILSGQGSFPRTELLLSGGEIEVTNNQMEMQALIECLKRIDIENQKGNQEFQDIHMQIKTDSKYVIKCWNLMSKYQGEWGDLANEAFLSELYRYYVKWNKHVEIRWVKGHSGEIGNEIVDELCTKEISKLKFKFPKVS